MYAVAHHNRAQTVDELVLRNALALNLAWLGLQASGALQSRLGESNVLQPDHYYVYAELDQALAQAVHLLG